MLIEKLFTSPFYTYFEGDDSTPKPEGDPSGDPTGVDDVPDPSKGGDPKKTYTQEEVSEMVLKERKRLEERNKKTLADLESLKKSKNLTNEEKANLQQRIDELTTSMMTKEQLAEKERKKLEKQYETELTKEREEKQAWQNRFVTTSILREISDAAHANEAFNPEIVTAVLQPITSLREKTDEEGNPIGVFEARVKYKDVDKDGKPVTLDLTVAEAVKAMKNTPDKYGSLFKSTATGGIGMGGSPGRPGEVDPRKMSVDEYFSRGRTQLGLGDPVKTKR